jgi:phage terminase large subunit-like protein
MGGDFSTTTDLSAICLVFPPQSGKGEMPGIDEWRVIWDCWIPAENMEQRVKEDHVPYNQWAADGWIHATEGDQIDYTVIEERIEELRKMYNVIELATDLSFATMLLQRLGKERLKVVDIPQQYAIMTDPMQQIEILLRKRNRSLSEDGTEVNVPALTHENHPVGRWCFGNASIAKNGNAQIKLVKEHKGRSVDRTKRIDLMTAWVNAMARAKLYATLKSVYETRGIRMIGGEDAK